MFVTTVCILVLFKTQLKAWQTRKHCCGNIVAHDVSLRAQPGKHLLRTQNVSEQNQKQMLRAGKRGNICVGNNVSSFNNNKCYLTAESYLFSNKADINKGPAKIKEPKKA